MSVIRVHHDLDSTTSAALAATIRRQAAGSNRHRVIALEHRHFCDANALSVLLGAKARLVRALRTDLAEALRGREQRA